MRARIAGLALLAALGCGSNSPARRAAEAAAPAPEDDAAPAPAAVTPPAPRADAPPDRPAGPEARPAEDAAAAPVRADASPDRPAERTGDTVVPAAASAIDRFRWELLCLNKELTTNPDVGCAYDLNAWPGTKDTTGGGITGRATRTFGGDPATTYKVTLRVRGVVEAKVYLDDAGMPDLQTTPAPHFHVGGKAANQTDNAYAIEVSDPKQVYFLNAYRSALHATYAMDYTATVPIRGGAAVTFSIVDVNNVEVVNYQKLVIPDIPPAPAPFNGQFIQLDVLSVAP